MTASDDGFVSRWSRRKGQSRTADPKGKAETPPQAQDVTAVPGSVPESAAQDEAVPADLPDPDTLTAESDFTVYLKDGVPEELKQRALRRLWRSNPVFANLDGLNDYDLDYTNAATVVAGLKTLYQVGRGFVEDEDKDKGEDKDGDPDTETEVVAEPAPQVTGAAEQVALDTSNESDGKNRLDQKDSADNSSGTLEPGSAGQIGEREASSNRAPGAALRRRWGGA